MFDEVMGLGHFADSSRGSATSSKSGGPDETKGTDKTSGQEEHLQEEDSNGSRREEKMEEEMGEPSLLHISSTSSDQHSLFTMGTSKGGAGRSGGAAFDDALDGLDDDEDWHFALPMDNMEDANMSEANQKGSQPRAEKSGAQSDSFAQLREEEDDEQEREVSRGSSNTSHSSQEHTPDNNRGKAAHGRI